LSVAVVLLVVPAMAVMVLVAALVAYFMVMLLFHLQVQFQLP
jgi:hypothetical protein